MNDMAVADIYIEMSRLVRAVLDHIRSTGNGRVENIIEMVELYDEEIGTRLNRLSGECFRCRESCDYCQNSESGEATLD